MKNKSHCKEIIWLSLKNNNFKQVRTLQLCYLTAQLEDIKRNQVDELNVNNISKCSWLDGNYLRYFFVSFFSCLDQKDKHNA